MYSIKFIKIETHAKLSFHGSDFGPPILPASTTYTKDGAQPPARRGCSAYASESDSTILGILGILAHFRHFPVYPG
jgi:hypothetical protein